MSDANGKFPEIKCVGVIGAGQMGNGIAHVFAVAGFDVRLSDLSEERLERARECIGANLDRQIHHDKITEKDKAAALARITTGTGLDLFRDCDLVIESVVENEDVKRDVLKQLCPLLKPDAIICSNTSSISITRLASMTDRPGRFMGMHFMNPVPVMQLVEMIRGIATDEDTFETVRGVVEALGKTSAAAEDFPAFMVNRVLMPMINEAIYTLYEGVGTVSSIDTALRLGANHPRAPPRRQPPDGPAGAGRLHRPRYLPRHHARALRRARGLQVPALSAAGQIRRGRLDRAQVGPRLLRLFERRAGSDPLGRSPVFAAPRHDVNATARAPLGFGPRLMRRACGA